MGRLESAQRGAERPCHGPNVVIYFFPCRRLSFVLLFVRIYSFLYFLVDFFCWRSRRLRPLARTVVTRAADAAADLISRPSFPAATQGRSRSNKKNTRLKTRVDWVSKPALKLCKPSFINANVSQSIFVVHFCFFFTSLHVLSKPSS